MRRYQRLQRVAAEEGDKADELQVYADFLRIVLEILNCIIVTNLPANPELIYAMLHQQEIFMPFQVGCLMYSFISRCIFECLCSMLFIPPIHGLQSSRPVCDAD